VRTSQYFFFLILVTHPIIASRQKTDFLENCLTALGSLTNAEESQFLIKNREENSHAMRRYGYDNALKLIQRHAHLLKAGKTVLELGPFTNPLGPEFGQKIHWLVWEYDSVAANQIAREISPQGPKRTVFHIDLNTLSKSRWETFLKENETQLKAENAQTEIGAAIFSSVLNYVNYRVVLKNVIERIEDKGLLIIANSEIAVGLPHDKNTRASPTVGIVEHLMSEYSEIIEFLEGSEINPESGISPSTIALAIKLHKKPSKDRPDQYNNAVMMYLEKSSNIDFADREVRNQFSPWIIETKSPAQKLALEKEWFNRKNRLRNEFFLQRNKLIEEVKSTIPYSIQWQSLKYQLKDLRKYELMPERRILLKSLDIADIEQRTRVITKQISNLYRGLNHSTKD